MTRVVVVGKMSPNSHKNRCTFFWSRIGKVNYIYLFQKKQSDFICDHKENLCDLNERLSRSHKEHLEQILTVSLFQQLMTKFEHMNVLLDENPVCNKMGKISTTNYDNSVESIELIES